MNIFKFYVCASFPFVMDGGMWHEIVSIPEQCLSIYFTVCVTCKHLSVCVLLLSLFVFRVGCLTGSYYM